MTKSAMWPVVFCFSMAVNGATRPAEMADQAYALKDIPIREMTVFKDGHAFVMHEGQVALGEYGEVDLDYLPSPVMGTFWPFLQQEGLHLAGVVAGEKMVTEEVEADRLEHLLQSNIGAECLIKENGGERYWAKLIHIQEDKIKDVGQNSLDASATIRPASGRLVYLQTVEGVRVVPHNQIHEVIFKNDPVKTHPREYMHKMLTLRVRGADGKTAEAGRKVTTGLMYLQKGFRWIPHYRVDLMADGKARVQLQATLLNELADIEGVTCHLVIGVPNFEFAGQLDPMALSRTLTQLSPYFDQNAQMGGMLSNAIQSQIVMPEARARQALSADTDLGPELPTGARHEDLFIFTVKDVTLKKGQRMVLPVAQYEIEYEDVYRLEIPFAPPRELQRNQRINDHREAELARMLTSPKVWHMLRLINGDTYPLTTAPVLFMKNGQVVSQTLMTYTAPGARTDVKLAAAVNIKVDISEEEIERIHGAQTWRKDEYDRLNMSGKIKLVNYDGQSRTIEVELKVLGQADDSSPKALIRQLNALEEMRDHDHPRWWGWYSWPWWWSHFNGVGQYEWEMEVKPGQEIELDYTWHYYYR